MMVSKLLRLSGSPCPRTCSASFSQEAGLRGLDSISAIVWLERMDPWTGSGMTGSKSADSLPGGPADVES